MTIRSNFHTKDADGLSGPLRGSTLGAKPEAPDVPAGLPPSAVSGHPRSVIYRLRSTEADLRRRRNRLPALPEADATHNARPGSASVPSV